MAGRDAHLAQGLEKVGKNFLKLLPVRHAVLDDHVAVEDFKGLGGTSANVAHGPVEAVFVVDEVVGRRENPRLGGLGLLLERCLDGLADFVARKAEVNAVDEARDLFNLAELRARGKPLKAGLDRVDLGRDVDVVEDRLHRHREAHVRLVLMTLDAEDAIGVLVRQKLERHAGAAKGERVLLELVEHRDHLLGLDLLRKSLGANESLNGRRRILVGWQLHCFL